MPCPITVDEATAVFTALAEGGTVTLARQPMFWAAGSGMLTDKFGTAWIVNGELQAVDAPNRAEGQSG